MAMNDVPSMPDRSYRFARRLIVMGYRRRFEEHEMDPELDQKLAAERDGIFNWSVFGLERLLRQEWVHAPRHHRRQPGGLFSMP